MKSGAVSSQELPEKYRMLGGRGLSARILLDEVPADCDPLGPSNKLIFAPGLLAGTYLSSANRISVGSKSPLTGGIKESNGGGVTALRLAQLGYGALIIEEKPGPGEWYYLVVSEDQVVLKPAGDLVGLGCFAAARSLRQQWGNKAALAVIGAAGENRMNIAGIAHADQEGLPTRYSARGGLGAVMGAKGLKAIVILPAKQSRVSYADGNLWRELAMKYYANLRSNETTAVTMPKFGTALTMELVDSLGGVPTRNFSAGRFEKAGEIGGVRLREVILARGGEGDPAHACMPGCVVKCSNRYPDAEGKLLNTPMEYENNVFLGSNLGIGDLDTIGRLNYLCNDLGVDVIETGASMAVAMEAGLADFGDGSAAADMLQQIGQGTELGLKLGQGALRAGKFFGIGRVAAFKGQTIGGYDPRALKVNGVTYASSPMGGDHTAGNGIFVKTDHLDPAGKVELSRNLQITSAWVDSLGLCTFVRVIHTGDPEILPGLANARYGAAWDADDLTALGKRVLGWELEFNRRAGLEKTAAVPEFLRQDPLAPHNSVFDVPESELKEIWHELGAEDSAK